MNDTTWCRFPKAGYQDRYGVSRDMRFDDRVGTTALPSLKIQVLSRNSQSREPALLRAAHSTDASWDQAAYSVSRVRITRSQKYGLRMLVAVTTSTGRPRIRSTPSFKPKYVPK